MIHDGCEALQPSIYNPVYTAAGLACLIMPRAATFAPAVKIPWGVTYDVVRSAVAGKTSVDSSFSAPLDFVKDNVLGTTSLLEACREACPPPLFVFCSTDEVPSRLTRAARPDTVMPGHSPFMT